MRPINKGAPAWGVGGGAVNVVRSVAVSARGWQGPKTSAGQDICLSRVVVIERMRPPAEALCPSFLPRHGWLSPPLEGWPPGFCHFNINPVNAKTLPRPTLRLQLVSVLPYVGKNRPNGANFQGSVLSCRGEMSYG